ncbi:MAG TPA: transglycosylase domain-containing protein [Thermodesulfobacteriota bacterium]|nr:transglycosylase domain-containing protein [Thermodesulfobacteriota bacterium]
MSGLIWGRLLLLKSKYHSVPAVGSAAAIINHLLPQFKRRRLLRGIAILVVALILGGLAAAEFKASYLGAQFLARVAHKLSFSIEPGPNSSLRFPQQGPYDKRLGYTQLPDFIKSLTAQEYRIEAQARASFGLNKAMDWGLYPTFREKGQAGLKIFSEDGRPLFDAQYPERVYSRFESIPPLIVNTLLFIENKELLDSRHPYRNPTVEWERLVKALLDKGINVLNPRHTFAGGSTLATQLEKLRHSSAGRTATAREKLKQMVSASLRAYLSGADTTEARRQIVVDYLNSVPLAALAGYGEVNGIGDALWAVYGSDFNTVNQLLCNGGGLDDVERARAYKQVLSLLIAQRRPSFYLLTNWDALESLTNKYLRLLAKTGIITTGLRDSGLQVKLRSRQGPPEFPSVSFVGRKAANAIRRDLSSLLEVPHLYELDRLDLAVKSTLNGAAQDEVSRLLLRLRDPKYVEAAGLRGPRLLDHGDPSRLIYGFTLYEHTGNANLLRIQTDNLDQPFDINEGMKIELGSTAKLRTLVTYLEIIRGLHERYAGSSPEKLHSIHVDKGDRLTQWALDYLSTSRDSSLRTMLDAAMERRYSASPEEAFFTGGGLHTFHNFDESDDTKILSVRNGLRNSVNLVFIRLMRDIVHHYMYRVPGSTARILANMEDPARQNYLSRFAHRESCAFLNRFYNKYRDKELREQLKLLLQGVQPSPERLAAVYRFIDPSADIGEFSGFLRSSLPSSSLSEQEIHKLYDSYGPTSWDLQNRGYIAGLHPLELWLVAYLRLHPKAIRSEVIRASAKERQEAYRWLFNTHRKNAQDIRIRSLLEVEAFLEIHRVWKRLGYPFDSLVPSYATAIGSSADRPASLAEFVGIISNHGIRYPAVRVDKLRFASATPYETLLRRKESSGHRVLSAEITAVVRRALIDVAERGSAQRIRGAFLRGDGTGMVVGGKTGTADNRHDTHAQEGQRIESHSVNRAAVFVFFIGDRFFGTMTAYVPGREAAGYGFTSSLPVQILKIMAPTLKPVIEKAGTPILRQN